MTKDVLKTLLHAGHRHTMFLECHLTTVSREQRTMQTQIANPTGQTTGARMTTAITVVERKIRSTTDVLIL